MQTDQISFHFHLHLKIGAFRLTARQAWDYIKATTEAGEFDYRLGEPEQPEVTLRPCCDGSHIVTLVSPGTTDHLSKKIRFSDFEEFSAAYYRNFPDGACVDFD